MMKIINRFLIVFTYLIIYFPILVIAFLSFNDSSRSHTFVGFSFRWYREIFLDQALLGAIRNTLIIALLSTLISTILGTLFAIGINSLKKNARMRMMILNNVPVVNPDIVTGISLLLVFSLLPISFGLPTMLLAHIFFSIPFVVLSVLPKLKNLDPNLYDAAIDLGASRFKALYLVIVPSIKVGIITGALIAFTMSIDDFVISYFVTGRGFNNVSIYIYSRLARKNFSPAVYAYNTLIVVITIIALVVMNSINKKDKKLKEKNS